jgi:cAMP-dependent protein kinase regulator
MKEKEEEDAKSN